MCRGRQFREIVADGAPQDVEADAVIGMTQAIPHASDLPPGLPRHEGLGLIAKPINGLANPFQATFDTVANETGLFEVALIHPRDISREPLGVIKDVRQ